MCIRDRRNLLSYYLKSRLVEDYDTLIELLISDRLKGSLPQGLLNYILTQEEEGWYVASKVASLADVYVNNRATVVSQKARRASTQRWRLQQRQKERRLARATEAVVEDITSQDEVDSVDLSHRPRRRKSNAIAVVSLGTWPGTVPRNEKTIMMVHHRLQGLGRSSATTAQDGDTWPEIVRQSRVGDVVVLEKVGEAVIEAVPEVMDRTEESAST